MSVGQDGYKGKGNCVYVDIIDNLKLLKLIDYINCTH